MCEKVYIKGKGSAKKGNIRKKEEKGKNRKCLEGRKGKEEGKDEDGRRGSEG